MSVFEHLFLDPGDADVDEASSRLVSVLGVSTGRRHVDEIGLWTARLTSDVSHVGGALRENRYGFAYDGPDDPADAVDADFMIFDDMPLLWSLWSDTDGDEDEQRRRARVVFGLVVSRLGWSAILTHDFEELVATYDPEQGIREFPPGTPADGTGRHLWAPGSA